MRIMVADQDTEHRQQLVGWIQSWGHSIDESLNGRDVIEQCRKKCPDLIFVDSSLSGQSGIETIRQIRQTGGHAVWVPIVLMQKDMTQPDILQAVEAGADDILQKPLNQIQVMCKVFSAGRQESLKKDVFKVAHELVLANRVLQSVVTQDVLTGIGNSNSFEESLEEEWFKAKNSSVPLSLVLLNLDFFQAYNQAYGAEAGDKVIKQVADCLKPALLSIPFTDSVIARLMGETFGILLPKTTREQAMNIGEKIRTSIEALKIPHRASGSSDHITASLGIATAEKDHFTTPWDLKDSADFALYKAKHNGRNRCVLVPAAEAVKS